MLQKILLVDDNAETRDILEEALLSQGYEVTTASNGQEALQLFRATPTDLLITDLNMPGIDGWQLCADFQRVSTAPILVVTGSMDEGSSELRADIRQLSDGLTQKPVDLKEFLKIVQRLLRQRVVSQ